MKRWVLFAAVVFASIFLVESFEISNDEDCSSEEKDQVKKKCPKHYKGFIRNPTDANNRTRIWCLRVYVTNTSVSMAQSQANCAREGAVLSTFASFDEQKYIVRHASKYIVRRLNLTRGAIWVDGSRIQECRTLNVTKQFSDPCNDKQKVFTVIDPRTDPRYAWTQWYTTSPTWAYYPYRTEEYVTYPVADSITADCVQMWINPRSSDRNGQLHSMHCDMAVPPYDYEKEQSTNYGYVCGRPPVLSFY